ncbi:MAG UNVERIFIED_CONTAM: hypothetical protein LVT10_02075 [Anaerolineae bacterium]
MGTPPNGSWRNKLKRSGDDSPSPMSVCAVVEGENGLIHGWSAGKAWIDSSTNDLTELQRLAQKCAGNRWMSLKLL